MSLKRTHPTSKIIYSAIAVISLVTVLFCYTYRYYPFPGNWNDHLLNFSFTFVAFLAAGIATLISRHFKNDEPPRKVWMNLALGLWCWTFAELIWAVIATFREVPDVSMADIPWIGAYYFLVLAFIYQFRLIARPTPAQERKWLGIALFAALFGAVLATLLARSVLDTEQTWFETYVSLFYVFADLSLAVAALKIASTFGRGLLGHAWIGLLAFAISDLLYSGLLITGLYAQSAKSDSVLSMIADAVYFDAYLITAITLLSTLLLLHYGPKPMPINKSGANVS